ncbi:MAG TPA: lipid kinase [Anaeromyxobacter sp.]|nr:lipid kinase [Anaeromyxobacter sp.]
MARPAARRRVTGPRTVLVVNAAARQAGRALSRARASLARRGVVLAAEHEVRDGAALVRAIRRELGRGAARVVVAGGDGTISAAAGVLAGTGAALGVLPLGTANDFARSLRIPSDLDRACAVVARGEVRPVDVAFAGRRPFLNAASAGASSAAARRLTPGLKRRAGALAYPVAAAGAARAGPFEARLEADGAVLEGWAVELVVGNGRYRGGGRLVAPRARPDDGRLDVYLVTAGEGRAPPGPVRRWAVLARYAARLLRGRHLEDPRVHHARAARVTVATRPRLELNLDGELAGWTPAEIRVAPGALRVLAPPPRRR